MVLTQRSFLGDLTEAQPLGVTSLYDVKGPLYRAGQSVPPTIATIWVANLARYARLTGVPPWRSLRHHPLTSSCTVSGCRGVESALSNVQVRLALWRAV